MFFEKGGKRDEKDYTLNINNINCNTFNWLLDGDGNRLV